MFTPRVWDGGKVRLLGELSRDLQQPESSLSVSPLSVVVPFVCFTHLVPLPSQLPLLTAKMTMMSVQPQACEEGCFSLTMERKFYCRGNAFVKRSLRPREYRTGHRGIHVPRLAKESLKNEAESLRYIRRHTNIPVPTVYCDFEDDEAYYLISEYVQGVSMSNLIESQKAVVREELQGHLATLRTLVSNRMGGPSGIVIPPYRVLRRTKVNVWCLRPSDHDEFVFCHNDLSQQNIIVDPDSLKIQAILDWEYAGFYPPAFEWPFYTRLGPSSAIYEERDDSLELLDFLKSRVQHETT
ncbi:kinase-like protein [Sodiomyces alkalinus F11]|uniref:Kinase-like protein n=1 Tax=Sodiomyces alkalinus (strain CBS 110278 / VKM F-3762 / F11) TaxID=1314773 RepID=A0A3N2PTL9_SODAK|nr:kinase-like protein [Sodiomyces alkalinus F11]ROT37666.1 kinase-like protein [Sodiomyces alkalinus F11]